VPKRDGGARLRPTQLRNLGRVSMNRAIAGGAEFFRGIPPFHF
jgi:hypothetical protein